MAGHQDRVPRRLLVAMCMSSCSHTFTTYFTFRISRHALKVFASVITWTLRSYHQVLPYESNADSNILFSQFDGPSPSATSGRLDIPQTHGRNGYSHGDLHDLRHRRSVMLGHRRAQSPHSASS